MWTNDGVTIVFGDMPLGWRSVTQEEADAYNTDREQRLLSSQYESLWQAAHNYEYAQISGSAIGLIALGVLQSKPKCTAVQGWIKNIWSEYYNRKAAKNFDLDFNITGSCPHTVPELMEELGL